MPGHFELVREELPVGRKAFNGMVLVAQRIPYRGWALQIALQSN